MRPPFSLFHLKDNAGMYDMAFQYFSDSAKQQQVDNHLGSGFTSDTSKLNWAMVFQLHPNWAFWIKNNNPSGFPIKSDTNELKPWATLNFAGNANGGANRILSCQTNISEIVRLSLLS
jgi:hypothetical protein